MASNRRSFLKSGILGTAALGISPFVNGSIPVPLVDSLASLIQQKPIVLSTWKFGLKANEEAWKILSKNGPALDAVEAGVMVVEADPEERSVGYGGRPDRDGRVTLDACIMDDQLNIGSVACLEHIMLSSAASHSAMRAMSGGYSFPGSA